MEDNTMKTTTETREDDNGGEVDMRDNGDGRQGQRWIHWRTSIAVERGDNMDGYGGGVDVGQ